jgi:Cof subfamily protein (haloacid dehalogenase superfamily)
MSGATPAIPNMIRLIALDVDGTLLDSRWQVPEANRVAIEQAIARGIEVALVTGRRFEFARPVIAALPEPLTLIVNNGALVKSRQGRTLVSRLLPSDVARQVLEATHPFRDTAAVVFDRVREGQVVVERIAWEGRRSRSYALRDREFVSEVAPLEACLVEDPIQVMFNGPVALMRELLGTLRGLPIVDRFAISVTEYESRDFAMVDIVRAGCSKGAALVAWTARQGLTRDEIMAVGDNLNDREMLEFAGCPVVMGNAVPELKAAGWPVTHTNDEAGVAAAIEMFALVPNQRPPTPTND